MEIVTVGQTPGNYHYAPPTFNFVVKISGEEMKNFFAYGSEDVADIEAGDKIDLGINPQKVKDVLNQGHLFEQVERLVIDLQRTTQRGRVLIKHQAIKEK